VEICFLFESSIYQTKSLVLGRDTEDTLRSSLERVGRRSLVDWRVHLDKTVFVDIK
jgi:hypothetical protein